MSRFLLIWLGQVFAGCGSNLATFCLGIWLYRESKSVTQFSLLLFFHTVPAILLAGVAGRVADRCNRRGTMLISEALHALVALAYLGVFQLGAARPWIVYLLAFAGGSLTAFQWPAYRSWSTQLVEARHFGRVGGIMKLGEGIPFLLGPVLGGAMLAQTSLAAVFGVNVLASLASLAVLAAVGGRDAAPVSPTGEVEEAATGSPLAAFLRARPGLVGLLFLSPFVVFTEGWVVALFQPFMLHHVEPVGMGLMLSLGGMGMVAGGAVMGIWGGPRRQIFGVLSAIFAQTLVIAFLAVTKPSFWSGTGVAFLYFFSIPFLSGSNQAIWQTLTPSALQGRMFAFRRAIEALATPASLLTAGILVDFVLEPLLAVGGPLSFLDRLISQGPAQGIAALFLTVSVTNLAILAAALLYRPVRQIDLEEAPASRATAKADRQRLEPAGAVARAERSA